jgi:2-oxoglutarate ferredoxin oxidoreductase subunit delta
MTAESNTSPVDTPAKKPRGRVGIMPERCKGCGYCVAFCPLGALRMSEKFNAKGYHYPEVSDPDKCSGCDLCGMYCPDFAICGKRNK